MRLKEEIIQALQKSGSDENLRGLADKLIAGRIALLSLVDILDQPKQISMRFIWLVGGLCTRAPELVAPCVQHFYDKRHEIKFANYDRSLAKMFFLVGVPENIEGELVSELFKWLMDVKVSVSTKHYALLALNKLAQKYPELKIELKLVIDDQLDKNTAAWRKQALRIREAL